MPELPEVETMCRGVAAAVGCRVRDLRRPKSRLRSILISPRIDHFRRRVVGRRIAAVRRVGKRVVLELEPARAGSPHPSPGLIKTLSYCGCFCCASEFFIRSETFGGQGIAKVLANPIVNILG